tara:strand:+ start:492 stop:1208 length:717 start_codon:yes stop_codon:yes gene_type:complete
MSFGSDAGTSGTAATQINVDPYAPAQPALNQIVSEASSIYNQGPQYVPPSALTLEGLAQQEGLGRQAYTQISDTLSGQYSNPFLSPLIAQAAQDVYSGVSSQFSGAGRTPGSPLSQQEVVSQVAGKALPYAFQSYDAERARQLQTAQSLPGVTQVGQTLEGYETQRLNAPQTALSNYANIANTVARGGQSTTTLPPAPNRMGQALGGAMIGSAIGNQTYGGMPGVIGGGIFGALGGLL